ncbi:hypothetical protein PVAP13_9NG720077 [Panicum virgatum]|uniref:Uncharacterized protein n=1 Tax=Panicum virgatum TaxID=38727 RepID=A0A8T0MZY9_PANVG|nr:hypothetical protein PVAP13_9NG720077 [Panicum virgatum]
MAQPSSSLLGHTHMLPLELSLQSPTPPAPLSAPPRALPSARRLCSTPSRRRRRRRTTRRRRRQGPAPWDAATARPARRYRRIRRRRPRLPSVPAARRPPGVPRRLPTSTQAGSTPRRTDPSQIPTSAALLSRPP